MNGTFLIADDSEGKRVRLRGLLHASGWKGTVMIAHTTDEAMRFIDETSKIDFAFVDYYMPSHNGPAVIRHLRGKCPQAKIALVSSADDPSNAREAREAGADAVVCTTLPDSDERLSNLLMEWRLEGIA
jgi:DNA-binding NarL/FixJ family response regulator